MRRWLVLLASVALVASFGGTASADTGGGGCLSPGQCRMTGQDVIAFWSGVPDGGPLPGVAYTDTYLTAGMGTFSGRGSRSTDGSAFFDQFTYMFDSSGNYIPIADTSGFGSPPDVSVSVTKTLSSGTLTGTLQATSCTFDSSGNESCGAPFTTPVSGTWTATGARLQMVSTNHSKSPGFSFTSTFQGTTRLGTATATIGGISPPGVLAEAQVDLSQNNTVSICHGPAC